MGRTSQLDRGEAVSRYLELRPVVRRRMEGYVPAGLREEFSTVTPHQLRALLSLPAVGLSMHELAEKMGVTGATASVLADRLVAQGLAVRRHDDEDRRVVRLVLSEEGRRVAKRARLAQRKVAESLFKQLSDAQVKAFLDVMEAMAAEPRDGAPRLGGSGTR